MERKKSHMQKQDNLKKNYIWNTLGTTFLSFNSLLFMIIVTRINGIEDGGIFSFSYASACIVNAIALFCGRTYQVTDDNKEVSEATYINTRILTCVIGAVLSLGFVLINHYNPGKASIFLALCVLKCIEALSDAFYGVLQKRELLYIAGKSMSYKSLLGLIGFGIIDFYTRNLYMSCMFLVVLNIVFLITYEGRHAHKYVKFQYGLKKRESLTLIKRSWYTFAFTLIITLIINIPRYIIDRLLDSEAQAIYGILSMPATFIMLFGQFVLQPSLTSLVEHREKGLKIEFQRTVRRIVLSIFGVLIIVLPAAYYIGVPLLGMIYGVDLFAYRWLLLGVIVGGAFYASSTVLLNALITMHSTKIQLILQLCMFAVSLVISISVIQWKGLVGSIVSYMLILILQFISYFILYEIELRKSFKKE